MLRRNARPGVVKATNTGGGETVNLVMVVNQLNGKFVIMRTGIAALILGATKLEQLNDNLQALDFTLPTKLATRLDSASALPEQFPYFFFDSEIQGMIYGGATVGDKPDDYDSQVRVKGAGAGVT